MVGIRPDPSVLPPGVDATEIWIADYEFENWVRTGRITPSTMVWAGDLSGRGWRRAEDLEVFHLFHTEDAPHPPEPRLRDRIFPRRGFSATELLLLVNILVAGVLVVLWQGSYGRQLVGLMREWHAAIRYPWDVYRMVPTMFIHADAGHLFRNLVALLVASGAVETFFGRRKTTVVYLATGMMGALFSYFGHARPPLSVGASGAVFGMAGAIAAFLFRFYPQFTERQRWKTRRVYAPLFLFLVPPSLFQADYYAHGGGFLMGVLMGMMLPLDERGEELLAPKPEDRPRGWDSEE